MRSNRGFIELTGRTNGVKYLINKRAIIFATADKDPNANGNAVLMLTEADRILRLPVKESYEDVSREIMWFDEKGSFGDTEWLK